MGSKICPNRLIFCPQVEENKYKQPNFLEKIILITRIWSKIVSFRFWPLRWMTPNWKLIFCWFWKKKKKILYKEYATLILLYLWAKYELTVQTMILVLVFFSEQTWHFKSLFWTHVSPTSRGEWMQHTLFIVKFMYFFLIKRK